MPITPVNSGRIDPARINTDTAQQPESSNRSRPVLEGNPALPSRSNSTPIRRSAPMVEPPRSGNASPEHEESPLLRGMSSNSQRFDLHAERPGSTGLTPPVSSFGGSSVSGSSAGGSFRGSGPLHAGNPVPTVTAEWMADARIGPRAGQRVPDPTGPVNPPPPVTVTPQGSGPGVAVQGEPAGASELGKRKRGEAAGTSPLGKRPHGDGASPLDKRQRSDGEKRARTGPATEPSSSSQPFRMSVDVDHASSSAGSSSGGGSTPSTGRVLDHAGGATFANWTTPRSNDEIHTATQSSRSSQHASESSEIHSSHRSETASDPQQVPPQRSWRSVAGAIAGSLGGAARVAKREAGVSLGVLALAKVEPRLLKALAGHTLHQVVAVGVPTLIREFIAQGVKTGLAAAPTGVTIGLQATMTVANVAMQGMREMRERRDPAAAAQGFHALTAAEWAAKPAPEKTALIQHQQRASRMFTKLQIMSSITNIALMAEALGRGDKAAAATPVANEIKTAAYAGMRDGIQATFKMVDTKEDSSGKKLAPGLKGGAHGAAAGYYLLAGVGTSIMGDALKSQLLPQRSEAAAVLTGTSKAMSHAEAWGVTAQSAAISAGMNVIAETADWFNRTQQHHNMTGHEQQWDPGMTKGDDYARLLDQAPSRAALINTVTSGISGAAYLASNQSPAMQQFIGYATQGAVSGLLDSPIEGLWGAQDGVRTAVREEANAAKKAAAQDIEMGPLPNADHAHASDGGSPSGGTQAGFGMSGHIDTPRASRANSTLDQRDNP